ncbi:hypothetical protein BDZ97DRAFT_1328691 [Flammula alnicola]|nr:hypothetical protein BDZ97DRAFT_1328691 [Flammula alnicola]
MQRNIQLPSAVVVCGIIALIASLFVHVLNIALYFQTTSQDKPGIAQFPIPIRPAALTTIKSPRFGLYADDSDWDSMLPNGAGFLYLPEGGAHYLVAHYHQLHCLRSLRHYFLGRQNLTSMDLGHVDHCLIYLRQMVLCNVDLTLEPASHKQRTTTGKVANTVTGVGVMHQCRDWSQVWDYMEKNYEEWKETYEAA